MLGLTHNKKDGIKKMINKDIENAIVAKQGDLLYTTLAEECTELAQACCKINRKKFLKEDILGSLDNFFEEICDLQINLQCIKQQVIKDTGMTEKEYDSFIRDWTKEKEKILTKIFLDSEENSLDRTFKTYIQAGYLTNEGEPIKCCSCGSKDLVDSNCCTDEVSTVAFDRFCHKCNMYLGHWEYGIWDDIQIKII